MLGHLGANSSRSFPVFLNSVVALSGYRKMFSWIGMETRTVLQWKTDLKRKNEGLLVLIFLWKLIKEVVDAKVEEKVSPPIL